VADEATKDEAKTYSAEEYSKLENHNKTLFAETKAAKDAARAAADEAKNLKAQFDALEQQKKAEKAGITSEQLEKMRLDVRQDLEKEFSPFKSTAEQLARENRSLKLDSKVKDAMSKNGVRAERIEALFRLEADKFDLTEDGKPLLRDRPGTEIGKFISEDLSKQYPEFFVGTGASGGGASKSTGGAGGAKTVQQGDSAGFLANLKGIADGSVTVKP
jgi:hypothetical protein